MKCKSYSILVLFVLIVLFEIVCDYVLRFIRAIPIKDNTLSYTCAMNISSKMNIEISKKKSQLAAHDIINIQTLTTAHTHTLIEKSIMRAFKFIALKHFIEFCLFYLLFSDPHHRPVLPSVEPGYLHKLLPTDVPEQPEKWQDVLKDIDRVIMPGITNWQSPNFHAYYPTATSYPSIVGETIAASLGIVGFSWVRV